MHTLYICVTQELHRSAHTYYICVTQEQYRVKFLLQSKLKFCKKSRIFLTKNSHFLSKRRFLADFRPIFAVFDNLKLFPVAFAVRSDSVRRPIRFRPQPDQIPFAARSDSVRSPIRLRTPSDQIPYGDGGISHPLRIKRLRRNNNGFGGYLQGGALVSSAPTKQAMHQPSKLCTNQASNAPTK